MEILNGRWRVSIAVGAVCLTLVLAVGSQLIAWGAMQTSVEVQNTAIEELKDAVIMHTTALNKRITIQERKFDERMLVLRERIWDIKLSLSTSMRRTIP